MKGRALVFLIVGLGVTLAAHSQKDTVLMIVDNDTVMSSKFKRVFLKNIDLVPEDDQQDIQEYLKLYKNYRLKLAEARRLGFYERPDLNKEWEGYRDQLAENYMVDAPVTDALVDEAYDHLVEEVSASHIMIKLDANATPIDTLKAFDAIMAIKEELLDGANFSTLAKAKSEDPSVIQNNGELGWFSAFMMVYPFEKAAFNTPVGRLSPIVRSRYGYHVLKTTARRASRGEVEVAHIMVSFKNEGLDSGEEARIREIYQKLQQGETFGSLAARYSDDSQSAAQGGKLKSFASGILRSRIFEEKAFGLQELNETTQPFKSEVGWHIIKLLSKQPVGSKKELDAYMRSRIKGDSRAEIADKALQEKLNTLYTVKEYPEILTRFSGKDGNVMTVKDPEEPILSINGQDIPRSRFASFLIRITGGAGQKYNVQEVSLAYDRFRESELKRYHKGHLAEKDPEYAQIIEEYREGIMLFAIMEEQVWNKAKEDSLGLNEFYSKNKQRYTGKERYLVVIASSTNEKDANTVHKYLKKGMLIGKIKSIMNTEDHIKVFFTETVTALNEGLLPAGYLPTMGLSKVYPQGDEFCVIDLKDIFRNTMPALNEVRGRVVNDYQQEVERLWLKGLESKHPVKVNDASLQSLEAQLSR